MRVFSYQKAATPAEAAAAALNTPGARFIAGGTNLLDDGRDVLHQVAAAAQQMGEFSVEHVIG